MNEHFTFNETSLRRFDEGDIPALVALINEAYAYQDYVKGRPRTSPEHLRKRASEVEFYVVEYNEEIIGCFYIEPRDRSLHFGLLTLIPEHRGTGLSQAIMAAIESYADAHHFTALELDYMSLAPWLKLYYENYGFSETGQVQPWGSIDLVRMKKSLTDKS